MYAIHTSPDRVEFPSYARAFAAMHDAMRRDAQRLVDAIDTSSLTASRVKALARWFDRFEAVIEHHHHCEDEIVWPGLEAIIVRRGCGHEGAAFVDARRALLDDHDALDAAMRAVRDTLAGTSTVTDRRQTARHFQATLDRHLTNEEAALFPLLLLHVSEEEFLELEQVVMEATPFTALTFTLPWIVDGASVDLAREILSDLPLPIRIANRWIMTPRYRRIVDAAMGVRSR
jgi:hemerythrin-like domain-containing protein